MDAAISRAASNIPINNCKINLELKIVYLILVTYPKRTATRPLISAHL